MSFMQKSAAALVLTGAALAVSTAYAAGFLVCGAIITRCAGKFQAAGNFCRGDHLQAFPPQGEGGPKGRMRGLTEEHPKTHPHQSAFG